METTQFQEDDFPKEEELRALNAASVISVSHPSDFRDVAVKNKVHAVFYQRPNAPRLDPYIAYYYPLDGALILHLDKHGLEGMQRVFESDQVNFVDAQCSLINIASKNE